MKLDKKKIPQKCGVYFFQDKHERILYIGKAVNLKNRLASYFKSQLGGRTAKLMQAAARVGWQGTNSEIEALILESRLIKKHRPPFNIMLRDDKQYFYVVFTQEVFPHIFLTHQPFKFGHRQMQNAKIKIQNDNVKFKKINLLETSNQKLAASFIGPFTDGSALKTVLKLLRRIFPYCTCKQKHNNFCLNYHIGNCLGFCCLKQQKPSSRLTTLGLQLKEYRKNIKAIKNVLSGKRAMLVEKLKNEMANLGRAGKFEEAIELRDKIVKLEKVFENAQIIQNTRYEILDTGNRNRTNLLNMLHGALKLPCVPKRIEGYDVSNIQGQFATGAMVVFTNGQPDKKEYRKFKIRSGGRIFRHCKTLGLAMTLNQKSNDTAMLKEVLTRRFNHPEWQWPNLIIIDGGKAQLNTACSVISNFQFPISNKIQNSKFQIPIIALTKNDKHRGNHIYVSNKKEPISLKKLPEQVRNLILQVDAEAHRFAIGYYRKLHKRAVKF